MTASAGTGPLLPHGFLYMTFNLAKPIHNVIFRSLRVFLRVHVPLIRWTVQSVTICLIVLVLTVFYVSFFIHLPARTKKFMLISLAIYLAGLIFNAQVCSSLRRSDWKG